MKSNNLLKTIVHHKQVVPFSPKNAWLVNLFKSPTMQIHLVNNINLKNQIHILIDSNHL